MMKSKYSDKKKTLDNLNLNLNLNLNPKVFDPAPFRPLFSFFIYIVLIFLPSILFPPTLYLMLFYILLLIVILKWGVKRYIKSQSTSIIR